MKKMFLAGIAALAIIFGMTGCGSSLSNDAVQTQVQIAARSYRSDLGTDIKVLHIDKHARFPFQDLIGKILGTKNLKGDEMWLVTITSSKWEYKQIQLYRSGSAYWVEYF